MLSLSSVNVLRFVPTAIAIANLKGRHYIKQTCVPFNVIYNNMATQLPLATKQPFGPFNPRGTIRFVPSTAKTYLACGAVETLQIGTGFLRHHNPTRKPSGLLVDRETLNHAVLAYLPFKLLVLPGFALSPPLRPHRPF